MVQEAVDRVVIHEKKNYLEIMGGLTPLQRRFLRGLAMEEKASIFSETFIESYELKTHSHVQRLVKSLEQKGILDEGKIPDVFFREWLRKLNQTKKWR
jgi:DNA-binding MarR family transcriptional regulator